MSIFESIFAPKLDAMLEYRMARGFKRETYLPHLIRFDKYCKEQFQETQKIQGLTADLVRGWLESETEIAAHGVSAKATAIREFGKYLCAIGEDAYVLPGRFWPGRKPKPPYIFTDSELTALFSAIDSLSSFDKEPYLAEMAPVLFRLTYTCGLRPNESRELKCENINLDNGEILLTNTKRNKERIIVMSDDMLALCREYDLRRRIFGGGSPYFFPARNGGALTNNIIYTSFNRAWRTATQLKGNRNVRVYDLRHRFASACLIRWLDEGENLMAMLPYLRAYMGHDRMDETAYYIHILPENLVKSSAIDWDVFNAMFPEVTV